MVFVIQSIVMMTLYKPVVGLWLRAHAGTLLLPTLIVTLALSGCKHLGLGDDPYADAPTCEVTKVIDGDSVMLVCDGRPLEVRLYCIDAPEMSQRPWGRRSREHLREIIPDQVKLISHDTDRYGRLVGELLGTDERRENINLLQVHAGQAAVYHRYCKHKVYTRAEQMARDIKSGIWESRGLHRKPWKYRRSQQ